MVNNLKWKGKGLSPEKLKILDLRVGPKIWRLQEDSNAALELCGTGCTLAVSPICHDYAFCIPDAGSHHQQCFT